MKKLKIASVLASTMILASTASVSASEASDVENAQVQAKTIQVMTTDAPSEAKLEDGILTGKVKGVRPK